MIQGYQYMYESYRPRSVANSPASRKSELKKVYENILKLSKNTCFYKINLSLENQEYAMGVKGMATLLKDKLKEMSEPTHPAYQKKHVAVSNKGMIEAKLIDENFSRLPQRLSLSIKSLATTQENISKDLFHPSRGLEPGTYEFRAVIHNQEYALSYNQRERLSNIDMLSRVAGYLKKSLPELNITVEEGRSKEYSHLRIESKDTGNNGSRIFVFEDSEADREGLVDFLELNRMTRESENSSFLLNDLDKQTNSNVFRIENSLQVTLLKAGDEPVQLRILNDAKLPLEYLDSTLDTFNRLLQLAKKRNEAIGESYGAKKLINEFKKIENTYQEELKTYGLLIEEDGTIKRDKLLSEQAAENGGIQEFFTEKNGFIARLLEKIEEIAINPMEYLDKTVVTYPDRSRPVANPYLTSIYSGLFYNSYC